MCWRCLLFHSSRKLILAQRSEKQHLVSHKEHCKTIITYKLGYECRHCGKWFFCTKNRKKLSDHTITKLDLGLVPTQIQK